MSQDKAKLVEIMKDAVRDSVRVCDCRLGCSDHPEEVKWILERYAPVILALGLSLEDFEVDEDGWWVD